MDDIKSRLQETSENCFTNYETWSADKKNNKSREDLQEAIHELRKVASRLEIEIAVSERGSSSQKPMPIPAHRDSKPKMGNDDRGNRNNDRQDHKKNQRKSVANSLKNKKSASGGNEA